MRKKKGGKSESGNSVDRRGAVVLLPLLLLLPHSLSYNTCASHSFLPSYSYR